MKGIKENKNEGKRRNRRIRRTNIKRNKRQGERRIKRIRERGSRESES